MSNIKGISLDGNQFVGYQSAMKKFEVNIASASIGPLTIITNDIDVSLHYADTYAFITMVSKVTLGASSNITSALATNIACDGAYGWVIRGTHTSLVSLLPMSSTTSGQIYLQAKSNGDIVLLPYQGGTIQAGKYTIIFAW